MSNITRNIFTHREQELLANVMLCIESFPMIDYTKLATLQGMTNVRSASNAWAAVKKKIEDYQGRREDADELFDSPPKIKTTLRKRPNKGSAKDIEEYYSGYSDDSEDEKPSAKRNRGGSATKSGKSKRAPPTPKKTVFVDLVSSEEDKKSVVKVEKKQPIPRTPLPAERILRGPSDVAMFLDREAHPLPGQKWALLPKFAYPPRAAAVAGAPAPASDKDVEELGYGVIAGLQLMTKTQARTRADFQDGAQFSAKTGAQAPAQASAFVQAQAPVKSSAVIQNAAVAQVSSITMSSVGKKHKAIAQPSAVEQGEDTSRSSTVDLEFNPFV
ncbi:hypothetical protein B0T24DRAFT_670818 [Lasiosphaeria ovina]|uniref:Uncharacterized protein n=1 Tax=Lasiosphaeria ovina TaxID=92902 RepID=A0AAE0JUS8_9PEZI|nr:hypothetical protein B0T24DRAFT_670818 [Lasiosphaeria ovina]